MCFGIWLQIVYETTKNFCNLLNIFANIPYYMLSYNFISKNCVFKIIDENDLFLS